MIMNNSLASMRPELVREWSDKNLPLTPDKITYGSNKIVWWKAACGHEWQTSVKARSKGENCPICSGARVIEGINDLAGKSGKHVMCEKPMAASYKEAQDMLAAAKESGKFLTMGYQTRSQVTHQYVRHMVERGELGEVYYVKAPSIRRRGVPLWGVFLDKEKQGGGPLIDIGTHSIDAALALIDNYDVESVTGSVYRKLADTAMNSNEWGIWDPEKFQVEDSAMGWVKFKNGATMVVEASWVLNYAGEANMTLCGTKGGVEFRGNTVRINGEKDGSLYTTDVTPNSTARDLFHGQNLTCEEYEAKQWIYSVVNNVPPITKPEQACVVSHIIEAIYESARTGKTIYF